MIIVGIDDSINPLSLSIYLFIVLSPVIITIKLAESQPAGSLLVQSVSSPRADPPSFIPPIGICLWCTPYMCHNPLSCSLSTCYTVWPQLTVSHDFLSDDWLVHLYYTNCIHTLFHRRQFQVRISLYQAV